MRNVTAADMLSRLDQHLPGGELNLDQKAQVAAALGSRYHFSSGPNAPGAAVAPITRALKKDVSLLAGAYAAAGSRQRSGPSL